MPTETFRGGEIELLADDDRPGGWLLLIDRVRQSYVDLEDPSYLEFGYVRAFAETVDALPAGPLRVVHVGGGAATFARWIAATRPGSRQLVLEPDRVLIDTVRHRLPFPGDTAPEFLAVDGRAGVTALPAGEADLVVVDAFHGGRVPGDVTTVEFFREVRRALAPRGLVQLNVADGPPLQYLRRLVAALGEVFDEVLVRAEQDVLDAVDFGNVVLIAGGRDALPVDLVVGEAPAEYESVLLSGAALVAYTAARPPLTDAAPARSPEPPDETWRVD